jgi:ABC-type glycerol-3-phosphate transport system substrate-binding protein
LIKRLIVPLFAVLVVGLVAAGCGSSDDGTGSTGGSETATASITKPELIKQGDAICEKGNQTIEDEADEFAEENGIDIENPSTSEQEEVVADVIAPSIQVQAEEIGALGAPSGEEDEVGAIVSAVEAAAEEAEENPSALVEGEGAGPFAEANELAKEYGFKVCGEE